MHISFWKLIALTSAINFALLGWSGAQEEQPTPESKKLSFNELVELITKDFPDHHQFALEIGKVKRKVTKLLQDQTGAERPSSRLVAAHVANQLATRYLKSPQASELTESEQFRIRLHITDRMRDAGERSLVRIWADLLNATSDKEVKQEFLFRLWTYYFFKERYLDAKKYGDAIQALNPNSKIAKKIAPYRGFLKMVAEMGTVPNFRVKYSHIGEKTLNSFRGKPVLLYFWTTESSNALNHVQLLRVSIDKLKNMNWDGHILGINLDPKVKTLKEALKTWEVDYRDAKGGPLRKVPVFNFPQAHLPKGFNSNVIKALGLPRAPMVMLLDAQGQLSFINQLKKIRVKKILREEGKFVTSDADEYRLLSFKKLEEAMKKQVK